MSDRVRPTLIELPTELRGERVVLRPVDPDEAETVYAAIVESREQLRPWMHWADFHQSVDDTREQRVQFAARWLLREELAMGVFERESNRYLGGIGLHDIDWDLRRFETGYWLRTSATGRGYATEAVILVRDFAFSELRARRLQLFCNAGNDASRRVAERAGFVLEGRLRNAVLDANGAPADRLVFSLIPEDWQKLQAGASKQG